MWNQSQPQLFKLLSFLLLRVILFLTLILLAKSLIVFKSFPLSFTCLSQDYNNFFLPFEASEHKHHVFYVLFSFVLFLGKLFRNSDLSLISLLKVNKSRCISLFVVKKLFSIDYVNISTEMSLFFCSQYFSIDFAWRKSVVIPNCWYGDSLTLTP